MNPKQIKHELQSQYPGKSIFFNDENSPSEIICEVESTTDHPDYSLAIAVIDKSIPHVHHRLTEIYKVIRGQLTVFIDQKSYHLKPGDSLTIKPNQVHWAEGDSTWIECHSKPGWYPDDHIVVGEGSSLYSATNPPPKTWVNHKASVKQSATQGKGLFTSELILKGEVVVIFGGEYTDAKGARKAEAKGKLVMQWDTNLFSVEDRGVDDGYFINHSCDSNLWMTDAFTLTARHDINPDQELTADYALWEVPSFASKWQCRCGSKYCRGSITGQDWRLSQVQKQYSGHFSPLINQMMLKSK